MENGRDKASAAKVTPVMAKRSRDPEARRRVLTRGPALLFPTITRSCYFQMTLPSAGDPASRVSTGQFGMKNDSNSWGLTPAQLRKLPGFETPHGLPRLLDDMPDHPADSSWT